MTMHPKGKELGTKIPIIDLNFIFNSKRLGGSCHLNLGTEETYRP